MRHVALTLTVLGVLAIFADRASAQGALSYPMAAHVAARYGVHHPGHNTAVIREVNYRQYGYGGHYNRRQYGHHGCGPVVVHRPVYRPYPVVVPAPVYPAYPSYYRPYYGFGYTNPRYSIRIGF